MMYKLKGIAKSQNLDLFAVSSNPENTAYFTNKHKFVIDEQFNNSEGITNDIMKYNYSKPKGGKYTKRMKRNTKRMKRNTKRMKRNRRRSSRL